MRCFLPIGVYLFMPVYTYYIFFTSLTHFFDSFLFLCFLESVSSFIFILLFLFCISVFIFGKTIELNFMCCYLLKKIFYFNFLSFKLHHLNIMITTNTRWVGIIYQVLGQIFSILTHLILRTALCNRFYYYSHFTNEEVKKRE